MSITKTAQFKIEKLDLRVSANTVRQTGGYSRYLVQFVDRSPTTTWSTGVVTIQRSLTGNPADAQDLQTTKTQTGFGFVEINEPVPHMHFTVTTPESGSGEIDIYIYADDAETA